MYVGVILETVFSAGRESSDRQGLCFCCQKAQCHRAALFSAFIEDFFTFHGF